MYHQKINVFVPFITLNGYVIECIEHILRLDYPNFLLILLPDEEITLPEKFANDSRIKIIVTGNETIARKRNMGIDAFPDCDYFAFIDSDAYPRKDWLKNAVSHFNSEKEIWAVGGPNITPPAEPLLNRVVGNASKSILISGMYYFRKRIEKNRFCNNLPTCNLIISKAAMTDLKCFNANLITGEDIDICNRIISKQKKIYYAEDVLVYHHNRQLFLPFIKQRITYGFSVFRVISENPSFSNFFLFIPLFFLIGITILGLLSLFSELVQSIFLLTISLYLIVIITESLRWSKNLLEFPGTFTAILLGNLSPGVGSLLAVITPKDFDSTKSLIRRIYKNF